MASPIQKNTAIEQFNHSAHKPRIYGNIRSSAVIAHWDIRTVASEWYTRTVRNSSPALSPPPLCHPVTPCHPPPFSSVTFTPCHPHPPPPTRHLDHLDQGAQFCALKVPSPKLAKRATSALLRLRGASAMQVMDLRNSASRGPSGEGEGLGGAPFFLWGRGGVGGFQPLG